MAQDDVLRGEVRLGDAPLTDATVVLHSVSATDAGEVDSVRVDDQGRFSFGLPDPLDDAQRNQIYFASVRRAVLR